jgi:class 3 adenylate cyclase
MRRDLPAGTVTFLFAEHRRVIRDACTAEGGPEVDRQGDAFFFAFPSAEGAASVAAAMTEALTSGPIRVRIGLHTRARSERNGGAYVGDDDHFAARRARSSSR